jgi:hypothetical protein
MAFIKKVTRRGFLKGIGYAFGTIGFASLGDVIFGGKDWSLAYPDEVLSIEQFTQGKIKPGDWITQDNVDLLKDALPTGCYELTKAGGQQLRVRETSGKDELMDPYNYDATEKSLGNAVLDSNGNLYTKQGKKWDGGIPFYRPTSGLEAMWDHVIRSKRADDNYNPMDAYLNGQHGIISRWTRGPFTIIETVPRIAPNTDHHPYYPGYEDELYRIASVVVAPYDQKGNGAITIQPYDQRPLPQLLVWNQLARRVLDAPPNQRFQLSTIGGVQYTSDLTLHNDPLSTWEWSIVETKPMLLPVNIGIDGYKLSWDDLMGGNKPGERPTVNTAFPGLKNLTVSKSGIYNGLWELRPEVTVIKGVAKDPSCPYSYKLLYQDATTRMLYTSAAFDRQGELWKYGAIPRSMVHFETDLPGRTMPTQMINKDVLIVYYDLQRDIFETSFSFGANDLNLRMDEFFTPDALEKMAFG